jgi:hypothetical protein
LKENKKNYIRVTRFFVPRTTKFVQIKSLFSLSLSLFSQQGDFLKNPATFQLPVEGDTVKYEPGELNLFPLLF